jgi:pyrroloquinoline quinone (PQQ) biosynthesis protein C
MLRDHLERVERESLALLSSIDHHPFLSSIVAGSASREDYVAFLTVSREYVRWSGPLLAETAAGLRRAGRYPWLYDLVSAKSEEEGPHHHWLEDDVRALGINPLSVSRLPRPKAIGAYIQWGFAMAEGGSPAYLGAAYALEFVSMHRAKMAADNLRARGTIAKIDRAVAFLVGHGEADVDHVARLGSVLERITDADDCDAVVLSAAVVRALYPQFFPVRPAIAPSMRAGASA